MARKTTKTTEDQTTLDISATTVEPAIDNTTPEVVNATVNAVVLPDLDAPAINTSEPAVSYKIDFSDKTQWFASRDGGKTKTGTGSATLAGAPIDLVLQLSKASWGDGYDQRLRLAFMEQEVAPNSLSGIGERQLAQMAELNINAVNCKQDGSLYVTSPARSLVGGLLAISESEDDMRAFCDYGRFRLKPGSGRGMFIEVDIAHNGSWIACCSPANTNRVAREPAGLHSQLTLIKQRFRGAGILLTAAAISGEIEGYDSNLRQLAAADDTL